MLKIFIVFIITLLLSNSSFSQTKAVSVSDIDTTSTVFAKVEKESEFRGGREAWVKFLQTHLVYPPKAMRKGVQGEVVLQFIVDKDGSLSDITAISGHPLLQKAALDCIRLSPKWIPATQDGKKVKSYKKQPFVFRLA